MEQNEVSLNVKYFIFEGRLNYQLRLQPISLINPFLSPSSTHLKYLIRKVFLYERQWRAGRTSD